MQDGTPAIEVNDLTVAYRDKPVLWDIDLEVPRGILLAIVGPNGAGKSTLMRTIATLQEPDAGTIRFGDIDVVQQKEEMRRTLGYLPQEFGVYPGVSAERLLQHFAVL